MKKAKKKKYDAIETQVFASQQQAKHVSVVRTTTEARESVPLSTERQRLLGEVHSLAAPRTTLRVIFVHLQATNTT